jgi:hypothetical protein|nr:MAG TPA: hypothetical protein [Caudoviricetes sp.]
MSAITENTLARINKWLSYGTSIETAFPKLEQRYRMQVCAEFYKRWTQNKDIDPRTVCRNIARRDYELFMNQAAQGNKEAQDMVLALHITIDDEGNIKPRTVTELNNDVTVCNYLIRFFTTDESPRHKAMYLSSAEWLIRTGKQQNNDRAVDKGMQALANVYGNFQEEKDATDEMPDMSRIAITQDVSIVKRDRINYTEEEKLRLARKYGLTAKDMRDIAEEESLQAVGKDTEPDYFEYMEQKDDKDVIRHGYMKESELTDSEKTDDAE